MKKYAVLISLFGLACVCGQATAGSQEQLVNLCAEQLNAPSEICACIGKTAGVELSSDEQRMVIAMITKDQETSAALRSSLPMESMVKAGMFMANAPGRCAKQMQSGM